MVSRPTPHALRSVQFPPPYVRHFYSTPPGHHLNLYQRDSKRCTPCCKCKHQICRCQNTLFNEWRWRRRRPAFSAFEPPVRECWCVCVALKYSFAQRWYTICYVNTVCARRPLFRWMKTLLTWKIGLYCWLNALLYTKRRERVRAERCPLVN